MKKRVFSLFMALALCLSMAPTVSFAEGTEVVAGQGVQSGENSADVYTTDNETTDNGNDGNAKTGNGATGNEITDNGTTGNEATGNGTTDSGVSGNDVSGGDAGNVNAGDVNTDEQDAEKDAAVEAAQALIDARPDEATAENADELQAQLIAIDEALAELTEEQIAGLNMTRYESICAALTGLVAVQDDSVHTNHPICGATKCTHEKDGSLEHGEVTWTPISTGDELIKQKWTKGNYYLTQNVTLSEGWSPTDGTVLCLNGHSITLEKDLTAVISVDYYGNFTLCDCSSGGTGTITHGTRNDGTRYTGAGVLLNPTSTFYMYGGTITNNSVSNQGGGGVYVNKSTFYMYNGEISGNTSNSSYGGGGVYVEGSFIMKGGSISGNRVDYDDDGCGGGVFVYPGGTFTMEGGSITGNGITSSTNAYGGGVFVSRYTDTISSGTFTMNGGSITDNTITASSKGRGGGVYAEGGSGSDSPGGVFTMNGGTITGNTVTGGTEAYGGGVYVGLWDTFTMSGAVKITDNKSGGDNNNVYLNLSTNPITIADALTGGEQSIGVTMNSTLSYQQTLTKTIATAGENCTLTDQDAACFVSDQGYFSARVNNEVQLLLTKPHVHFICGAARGETCGHVGDAHTEELAWIGITSLNDISSSASHFNYYLLNDITLDGDTTISKNVNLCLNGNTITGGALIFDNNNFTLCDCADEGEITGSTSQNGGICLRGSNGGLTMYGGSISGNNTLGVYVDTGTFHMYGGEITGNHYEGVDGYAGGVYVEPEGAFYMYGNAKISGNTATFTTRKDDSGYYGAAGVYVNGGTFHMTDNAEISGNTLITGESIGDGDNNYAGGVYVRDGVSTIGVVTVGGKVKITGNTKDGNASNVCLPGGKTITVDDALTDDASIGVITETPIEDGDEAVVAQGTNTYTLKEADLEAFSSDAGISKILRDGSIIFQNGEHRHFICGKETCSDDHGTAVKWKAISSLDEIQSDGYYFLKKDVDLTSTWNCSHKVKLCLNGHKITDVYGEGAITVESEASLDITDCQKKGKIIQGAYQWTSYSIYVQGTFTLWNGSVTENTVMNGAVYVDGGTFTMNGGTIAGNKNTGMNGGGVYVINDGSFTMNGGIIAGNTGDESNCGGVGVGGGTFTMNGGTITGNTGDYSGGVYVRKGSFTMTGGDITGNTGNDSGGVLVVYDCTFTMTGGTITGNNTTSAEDSCAGGVYVNDGSTFTVSGEAQITDNWKNGTLQDGVYQQGDDSTASNVYLPDRATITIEGLTQSARIGVSKDTLPEAGEEVIIANGATGNLDYEEIFTLDLDEPDPYYSVVYDSGNVYIRKHQHNWTYKLSDDDSKTIIATCNADHCPNREGGSVTIVAPEGTLVYDGIAKEATVRPSNDWQGPTTIAISYTCDGESAKLPINAGSYTASITLDEATASVSYKIGQATLAASDYVFNKPEGLIYDGKDKSEDLLFNDEKKILKPSESLGIQGGSWTRFYKASDQNTPVQQGSLIDAGTYIVKIEVYESQNYYGATLSDPSWTFTIAPITTEPTVTLSGTTYTYTGKQIRPEKVTVKVGDTVLVKDTDYTVTYGGNTNAGIGTVTVTAVQGGNYAFTEVTKEFTIEQAKPELSFGKSAESKTYIDEPFTNPLTHKGDGKVTYTSSEESVATVDKDGKVTIVGVGETTITATVPATTNYEADKASYTLKVDRAEIYVKSASVSSKTYDGGQDASVTSVSFVFFVDGQEKSLSGLVFGVDYKATGKFDSLNAGDRGAEVKVTLSDDCAQKYNLKADIYDARATIKAKSIRIGNVTVKDRGYKQGDTSVTVSGVTFLDEADELCTMLTEGTDYTVTGVMEDANIGVDKKVTVTVTLKGDAESNYSLRFGNTTTEKVTISKAAGGKLTAYNFQQKFSDRKEKTFTPDYSLPDGEKWTYSISEAVISGSAAVEAVTIDPETGKISYKLTDGAEKATVSWTVTITNDNYEDFTKEIVLTLTAKDPQAALYVTGENTVVYGKTLTLGIDGGSGTGEVTFSIDKANSTGEATIDANGVLTPVKAGTITVIATKAGDDDYNEAESTGFVIEIKKATVTGEPNYTKITTGGKTLADAGLTLTGSTLSPAAGTLEWIDADGKVLTGDTKVEVNKTYKWRFTPEDGDNYDILTGGIELYHVDMPVISAQPKDVSVKAGEKAVFEVTATGTDLTYQWQIDRNDGRGFVVIDGATGASYTSGVTDMGCNGFKYQCIISNAAGSVTTDTVTLTVTEEAPPAPKYEIIEGADSSWTQSVDGGLAIRGNGEFADFQKVLVDGKVVDRENYTVTEGSTIITLKPEFLSTLSEGSHTFEIVWTNGFAATSLTVAKNSSGGNGGNGNSGNSNNGNSNSSNAGSGDSTADKTADTAVIAPKTGDASKDALLAVLAVVSFAGLAGMLVLKKKNTYK